jgi:hypothetical protein
VTRVSKAILLTLAGILCGGVLLGGGASAYLGSLEAHTQLERALSGAIGMPVKYRRASFSFLKGLRVEELSMGGGDRSAAVVPSVVVQVQLAPLLGRKCVVERVDLVKPKLTLVRSGRGNWGLPFRGKSGGAGAEEVTVKERKPSSGANGAWRIDWGMWSISEGTVELLEEDRRPLGLFESIVFVSRPNNEGLVGSLKIGSFDWQGAGRLERIESEVKCSASQWLLSGLRAGWAGGSLSGEFAVSPAKLGRPFEMDLKLSDVDAGEAAAGVGWYAERLSGRLKGQFSARGELEKFKKLNAEGELGLESGVLHQMDLLQAIGQILKIEELEHLALKTARARFRVAKEKTQVEELVLEAARLTIAGAGTVQFDGKVSLDATLSLQEGLAKRLPEFIRESFSEASPSGQPSVAFKVTGKSGQLKTDLAEKLVGKKVSDQLENLVSGLFGGVRKEKGDRQESMDRGEGDGGRESKKKKKKKKDEPKGDEVESPTVKGVETPGPAVAPEAGSPEGGGVIIQ